ncbi:ribokinase [Parafrankia sp. EUN1f]|uniref:ribokinase n=1 Tax=Parafrankia sp. EUN1f TaxID=102897 RepID=UPI0001C44A36|nr:ribokinase [Parafrankia sp. EUN1f]EFC85065.1 PfkB domain protein [Parafrankia sp. EUN1f]
MLSRVVVVGSVNMDVLTRCVRMPRPGETVPGSSVSLLPGGKGANQAVAARRAGAATSMVGAVGDDDFGRILRDFLDSEHLDLGRLAAVPGASGTAVILVDGSGENAITIVPGANDRVLPNSLDGLPLAPGEILLLQDEIPETTNIAAVARARAAGAVTVLNLAPYRPTPPEVLRDVDYLVVNETEFANVTGVETNPVVAMTSDRVAGLLADGAGVARHVVVTLGAEGLLARLDGTVLRVPGFPVTAVDTTGAGDCFCGAFGAALARGDHPEQALRYASAAAALSVRSHGAGPSMPTDGDINHFLGSASAR